MGRPPKRPPPWRRTPNRDIDARHLPIMRAIIGHEILACPLVIFSKITQLGSLPMFGMDPPSCPAIAALCPVAQITATPHPSCKSVEILLVTFSHKDTPRPRSAVATLLLAL